MKKIILMLSIFAFCSNCLIGQNPESYFPYVARQKTFGSSKQDYFSRVQKTNDGGYILSGISRGGISGDKTDTLDAYSDYWIIKTDSNFTMQWQKTLGKLGFSEGHTGTGYLYNLGVLLGAQKKVPEALNYYQKALDLNPASNEVKHNIELLIQQILSYFYPGHEVLEVF